MSPDPTRNPAKSPASTRPSSAAEPSPPVTGSGGGVSEARASSGSAVSVVRSSASCSAPPTDSTGIEASSTLATRRRGREGRRRAGEASTIGSSDTQWPLSGKHSLEEPCPDRRVVGRLPTEHEGVARIDRRSDGRLPPSLLGLTALPGRPWLSFDTATIRRGETAPHTADATVPVRHP